MANTYKVREKQNMEIFFIKNISEPQKERMMVVACEQNCNSFPTLITLKIGALRNANFLLPVFIQLLLS